MGAADFSRGYVIGQTYTYIEQVITGAKLAAQLGCSEAHLDEVLAAITAEGCRSMVEARGYGRVSVWIFKQDFVGSLIEQMSQESTPPTLTGVWSMGKLFGYSDSQIGTYLRDQGLVK
jgi:biotin operon repressor